MKSFFQTKMARWLLNRLKIVKIFQTLFHSFEVVGSIYNSQGPKVLFEKQLTFKISGLSLPVREKFEIFLHSYRQ